MKAVQPAEALVLSSIQLDAAELSADKPTSTIQLSKTGEFKSARYGKFSITTEHIDKMVANRSKSVNDPPVDYHHLSLSAVLPDQALAAGWIKTLEKRSDDSLWGSVEWTPKAAQHIRDGEYKYISPVILWDCKDEQGESQGTTLMSAALTIYPFLKGMQPVALSELMAEGIVLADLSIDQRRGRIAEALQSKGGWLRDVFDKFAVYEIGSKLFKQAYKINKKLEVSFDGDPVEVVPQYVPLTSPDGGIKPMAEEKTPVPEPNADVVKLQSDFVALQTQLTETMSKMTALTTALDEEKTTSKKLRDDITKTRAEAGVSALIRQGKIVPAQKDKMVELAIKDPIFFEDFIKTMPVVVKLSKVHGTNDGDEAAAEFGEDNNDPIKLFDDKVAEWQEKNVGKPIGDAIKAVDKANPGLYEQRRLAYAVKTAVNGSVGDVQ